MQLYTVSRYTIIDFDFFDLTCFHAVVSQRNKEVEHSRSFKWNAPEVVSLCAQGCLYIVSKIMPINATDSEDECRVEVKCRVPVSSVNIKVIY